MADNPINPANFPNPSGGPSQAEIAKFQATIAEAAKKMGVNMEKSYIDAYKKVTKVADLFEQHIRKQIRDRYSEERKEILHKFGQEMQLANQSQQKQAKAKETNLKKLFDLERRYERDVAKEKTKFQRESALERAKGTLKKEITSLPGIGGIASAIGEGGIAGGLATAGITTAIAAIGTFVTELFKVGTQSDAAAISFRQAGVAQKDYQSIVGAYSGGEWKKLGIDASEIVETLANAPKVLGEAAADNFTSLQKFQNEMGKMGVSVLDSAKLVAQASVSWGGGTKSMIKQAMLATALMRSTGMSFNSLYGILQDLDPAFKSMTFSADKAAAASNFLAATLSVKLGKEGLGLTQEEVKQTTKGLADFTSGLDLGTWRGIIAFTDNLKGLPSSEEVVKTLDSPINAIQKILQFSNKLTSQGQDSLQIISSLAKSGAIPAQFATPKGAVEFQTIAKEGTDAQKKFTMDALIAGEVESKRTEALKRAQEDGIKALANLNNPLVALANSLKILVDHWVANGALLKSVDRLQDTIAHPESIVKGLLGVGGRTGPAVSSQKTNVNKTPRDSQFTVETSR